MSADSTIRAWIARSALDALHDESTRFAPDLESGGLVLGYWASVDEAVIAQVTRPGPLAIRRRHGYVPDGDHDQQAIADVFAGTDGAVTYLGDWHSHPRSSGRLSPIDRRTLRRIAEAPEAATPHPLMIVVTGKSPRWALSAKRGYMTGFGPFVCLRVEPVRLIVY